MSRPCECDRFRIVNGAVMMPPDPGECELCIAFAVDATRRAAWGGDDAVMPMAFAPPPAMAATKGGRQGLKRKPKPPALCSLRGSPVPGPERQRLGLSHAREWVYCQHPKKPLKTKQCPSGEAVCGCLGCGKSCTGYTRDEDTGTIALPLLRSDADSRNVAGVAPVRQVPDGVHHRLQSEVESRTAPVALLAGNYLARDGAPGILLNLAKHLPLWTVRAHSPHDGPRRAEYAAAGIPLTIGTTPGLAGVDLVVANTLAAAYAVRAAKEAGVPCVWLIHESDPTMCGNVEEVRELIGYPDIVVFPCQATADAYRDFPAKRVAIVPSIIPPVPESNIGLMDFRDGRYHVLTFGHDEPRKGQADIRAAVDGMEGVRYTAVRDANNPHEWLQVADLYVCSSRVEAFPLSIQEAKAYGLPVITTPVFGCSDIIRDGIDGLHYQPGDVTDLRAKIERIRTDAELRTRLSKPLSHLPTFAESIRMYGDALASAFMPRVVYHVAGMGPWWKTVVGEQLTQLRDAGLTRILCTHVGEGEDWLRDKAAATGVDVDVVYHSDDVRQWECPAIRLVERLAKESDKPILYLHAKGVSHDPATEPVFHEWRRLMMRELVSRWMEHVPKLRDHDAVGVNWWTKPTQAKNHFSGNFWLARPSWVRKLPPFDAYFRDRYSCERWIGATPGCRAVSLFCENKRLWDVHSELIGVKT